MGYDVFISYSRKDSQIVNKFVSKIEQASYKVWIDKKSISGGDPFQSKIVDAIDNSAILLFFSSVESNKSQRVIDEICYAQSSNKTIIPIKLDDTMYNREFILRLNRINSIQYDAEQPSTSFEELITSIEDNIGRPRISVPPKSAEELFELWESFFNNQDYENAVKYCKLAAEQGDARAQYRLGTCYYNGLGIKQDGKEGVKWYKKAAEQGHAGAQCHLGLCYEHGWDVTKDMQEAIKLYRKAAEQGDAVAQSLFGLHYEFGRGVSKDEQEAIKWYKKAAEQGNKGAIMALKRLKVE